MGIPINRFALLISKSAYINNIILLYKFFCYLGTTRAYRKQGMSRLSQISDLIDWVPIRQILDEIYDNRSEKGGRPKSLKGNATNRRYRRSGWADFPQLIEHIPTHLQNFVECQVLESLSSHRRGGMVVRYL